MSSSPSSSAAPPAVTFPSVTSAPPLILPDPPPLAPSISMLPPVDAEPQVSEYVGPCTVPSATCVEDFGDEILSPPVHPSLVLPSQNQSPPVAPHISLIGAHVFHVLLKKPSTQSFKIWSTDSKVKIHSTKPSDGTLYDPLKGVPEEYHRR